MDQNNQNKFSLFKKKEPHALTKEEIELEKKAPRNIGFFIKLFKRNFSKLISLNLMMLFKIFPLLIAGYVYLQGPTTGFITSPLTPTLGGVALISGSPAVTTLASTIGITIQYPQYNSPALYIIAAILVVLAITWGWQNVGSTYVLRSMVRGEPVFLWSDYFYAIKRNLKQGLIMGILDFGIMGLLAFDIMYFSGISGSFAQDVMYFCSIGLAVIYCFMRFYIYTMLITFDLSIYKIMKNALIFTAVGIKRNFVSAVCLVLLIVVHVILIAWLLPSGIVLPLILPIFYFPALSAFASVYTAYPNIKKYMIDPQQGEE